MTRFRPDRKTPPQTTAESVEPRLRTMVPEPSASAPPPMAGAGEPPARVPLLQRLFGLALAGLGGLATLALLLLFAVVAFLSGHGALGGVLLALLLLAGLGLTYLGVRTARQGVQQGRRQLRRVQEDIGQAQEQVQHQAARRELAALWDRFGTHLPAEVRPALRATITATDAALIAVADDPLGRERYEVQQAATQDLPALLELHRRSDGDAAQLRQSLGLIEARMRRIAVQAQEEQEREAAVQREYLNGKYAADLLDSDRQSL
ncbi:MAG: hypothetical protein Q4C67_10415 [Deinococcus sp.]|nr:hypothetical protein [Deinococcus sp.]